LARIGEENLLKGRQTINNDLIQSFRKTNSSKERIISFIHTSSPGIFGAGIVLFSIKLPKDVMFVEFELVVLQG
jgi:hypothetical protein